MFCTLQLLFCTLKMHFGLYNPVCNWNRLYFLNNSNNEGSYLYYNTKWTRGKKPLRKCSIAVSSSHFSMCKSTPSPLAQTKCAPTILKTILFNINIQFDRYYCRKTINTTNLTCKGVIPNSCPLRPWAILDKSFTSLSKILAAFKSQS